LNPLATPFNLDLGLGIRPPIGNPLANPLGAEGAALSLIRVNNTIEGHMLPRFGVRVTVWKLRQASTKIKAGQR
jgi:hypothetical protein